MAGASGLPGFDGDWPDARAAHLQVDALCDAGGFARVPNWRLEAIQVSAGSMAGTRRELRLEGLHWMDEDLREVTLNLHGLPPPDSLVFGIAWGARGEQRINGVDWRDGDVALGSSEAPVEIVLQPVRVLTLVVRRRLLAEHLDPADPACLDDGPWQLHPVLLAPSGAVESARSRLQRLADDIAAGPPGAALSSLRAAALRSEILDVLADLLMACSEGRYRHLRRSARTEVIRQVRQYVAEQGADRPVQVEDLCRVARMPRRSLQRCFCDIVGVTPVQYLRLRRLSLARDLLLRTDGPAQVQDVLEQLGIWHASRFAGEYRSMFGELPSETLRRSR
jgi:AraC family ethanolamine operon transcriptional activator